MDTEEKLRIILTYGKLRKWTAVLKGHIVLGLCGTREKGYTKNVMGVTGEPDSVVDQMYNELGDLLYGMVIDG